MRLLIATDNLVLEQFVSPAQIAQLEQQYKSVLRVDPSTHSPQQWSDAFGDFRADAVMTGWGTQIIPESAYPALRYVAHLAGGIRHLVKREALQNGLMISNWGAGASSTVAEHALLLILNTLRHGTQATLAMHCDGEWPKTLGDQTRTLYNKRVGIHGFGHIARRLVKLLAPFDCKIAAYSVGVPAEVFSAAGVAQAPTLEALFEQSDVLAEVEALTPQTRHSVTESILRRLPSGASFVNVGRGAVVDEAGLIRVALEGDLQIGLDVFEDEPPPPDSSLRGLRNVTLTPHIAGPTLDHRRECGRPSVENLLRFARGEKPINLITVEQYDRST